MNHIYIGDRQLDPDDEPEVCETCQGMAGISWVTCPECKPDTDPGEPNEDPA